MTISAKIIAKSYNPYTRSTITTWELEYPRFIHAEFMTHRMFSRNSASSRAIPVISMLENIKNNPATFVHWGKNQAGMQAKEELQGIDRDAAEYIWKQSMEMACHQAEKMHNLGVHKQIVNRITEPYQHMKVIMTATDMNNWYWLRNHPDAQPEIRKLAHIMQEVDNAHQAVTLAENMWHLPYVKVLYLYENYMFEFPISENSKQVYFDENNAEITLEEALMISASCCAQVSYRKQDGSLEKAELIFKRLVESEPCHASPVEHQAKCFSDSKLGKVSWNYLPEGITHIDRNLNFYSGNLRGWIQYRQLIPNNVKEY